MSYEKPELLVLSVTTNGVRRIGNDNITPLEADGKISNSTESNTHDASLDLGVTSSSGSAYEADE